ncbi:MAG: RIP metalloprotease RseP, partial [bacterium]
MNILIFIIMLLVLVVVHEFGHFFAAKRFGIRVDEFGFGFPPKLFGIKKGETEYTLNALPFGGFVKIFGENPDEENTSGPDAKRSFVNKPRWKQAIVLFAGIFSNFLLAWLLFSIGFMSGLPTSVGSQPAGYTLHDVNLVVVSVMEKSPAALAGLKSGDKILNVNANGETIIDTINPDTFKAFIVAHPEGVTVSYSRGKNAPVQEASMVPEKMDSGDPLIGISMDEVGTARLPFFKAFAEGLKLDWSVTKGTVVGLYSLIRDSVQGHGSLASVTGPVGMVGIVGDAYQFGWAYLFSFAALISVNLAIINLIPFPALDGGRLFFLLIEKIKGSRINPKIANTINMVGFALLILLMLVVTYHDIAKLF